MAKRKEPHPHDAARDAALDLIGKIADRAVRHYASFDIRVDRTEVVLDLTACHFKGQRLRLDDLLAADDLNFVHDIGGINKHLDRTTFKLLDGFSPRFSHRGA